jgi:hypothetical protein
MAEMYRQFAQIGGIPMESQVDIKATGEGMVAAAMARMGGVSTATTIDSVETGPWPTTVRSAGGLQQKQR